MPDYMDYGNLREQSAAETSAHAFCTLDKNIELFVQYLSDGHTFALISWRLGAQTI